tara:strand:+ start:2193 stop:2396 length:204 start_codon:yes stop_codon:yes gene_type:complete
MSSVRREISDLKKQINSFKVDLMTLRSEVTKLQISISEEKKEEKTYEKIEEPPEDQKDVAAKGYWWW